MNVTRLRRGAATVGLAAALGSVLLPASASAAETATSPIRITPIVCPMYTTPIESAPAGAAVMPIDGIIPLPPKCPKPPVILCPIATTTVYPPRQIILCPPRLLP
ncbi:hypothetical protein [Motilibacter aurantiacus]|uniref:hypothetical protein n=1 Tax=Motilibacter aurantiacus TaxID=2714955 RepID=UPI00140CF9E1|nr:hypothetical protein [Motilibacter aurantiacus]NHC43746.1 hypothetical protein [Motilibacter aurantiacus]